MQFPRFPAARLATGLMLVFAMAAVLRADTLTLGNGDEVSGKLIRADAKAIIFNADLMGNITLQWKQIRTLNTAAGVVVIAVKGPPVSGTLTYANGQLYILPAAGPEIIWPLKRVHLILSPVLFNRYIARHPNAFQGWHGAIAGGLSFVSATQSSRSYTTTINLTRPIPNVSWLPPRSNTQFSLQETYGSLTQPGFPEVKTSVFSTQLEQDKYFSGQFFVLGRGQLDHNFAQGLQLQQSYGSGIGWTALPNLNLKVDLHVTIQQFFAAPRARFLASDIAETYARKFGAVQLTEALSADPSYTQSNAFQATGSTAFAVPIYKRLGFQTTLSDSYLGNPQPGFRHNSFQFSTGLQVTLP
ncbi:MAG: DUF481 domain-containing protein [Terriglobales bacterium]